MRYSEARKLGIVKHSTGALCAQGHSSERYASTGQCIRCVEIQHLERRAKNDALKAPDEILSLTPEERAYMAGLIDGEGCIFAASVGPNRHRTVYPIVCVAMTHYGVIEWLCLRLKAGTVKNHGSAKSRPAHYKPQYRFSVFGKRAILLCSTLLPYLKVKRRQAELVLLFPPDQKRGAGVRLDCKVNLLRHSLRDQINNLNR